MDSELVKEKLENGKEETGRQSDNPLTGENDVRVGLGVSLWSHCHSTIPSMGCRRSASITQSNTLSRSNESAKETECAQFDGPKTTFPPAYPIF